MTPQQYVAHLRRLGLTPYGAGPALGICRRQSIRYAMGHAPVPEVVAKLVRALVELRFSPSLPPCSPAPT